MITDGLDKAPLLSGEIRLVDAKRNQMQQIGIIIRKQTNAECESSGHENSLATAQSIAVTNMYCFCTVVNPVLHWMDQ